jgi:hypothetical protein
MKVRYMGDQRFLCKRGTHTYLQGTRDIAPGGHAEYRFRRGEWFEIGDFDVHEFKKMAKTNPETWEIAE